MANPTQWTEGLLQLISGNVLGALAGAPGAAQHLESQLLYSQQTAFQNPFVSCSYTRAVALGFACADDTPGYLITLAGDWAAGFDFEYIRKRFNLFADAMDYLKEFGIPRLVEPPFQVVSVDRVDINDFHGVKVFP